MSWPVAIALAILQGLTEFLPVSSSGHLTLLQNFLERTGHPPLPDALGFDLLVHLGTLLAVVLYFRGDLARLLHGVFSAAPPPSLTAANGAPHNERRDLGLMALALLPTGIIGLALKNQVDSLLHSPVVVSMLIGVTGIILLSTRLWSADRGGEVVTWVQAVGIGAAQGLAVLPGLSRSGLTIAAGVALGMRPLAAFRWSFLLSIPAVAGAALLEFDALRETLAALGAPALTAAAVAALTALATLHLLARLLRRARFHQFAWYCMAVALFGSLLFSVWLV